MGGELYFYALVNTSQVNMSNLFNSYNIKTSVTNGITWSITGGTSSSPTFGDLTKLYRVAYDNPIYGMTDPNLTYSATGRTTGAYTEYLISIDITKTNVAGIVFVH